MPTSLSLVLPMALLSQVACLFLAFSQVQCHNCVYHALISYVGAAMGRFMGSLLSHQYPNVEWSEVLDVIFLYFVVFEVANYSLENMLSLGLPPSWAELSE